MIDDLAGIVVLVLDGLFMGVGDVVIGINLVFDNIEIIVNLFNLLDEVCFVYDIFI